MSSSPFEQRREFFRVARALRARGLRGHGETADYERRRRGRPRR